MQSASGVRKCMWLLLPLPHARGRFNNAKMRPQVCAAGGRREGLREREREMHFHLGKGCAAARKELCQNVRNRQQQPPAGVSWQGGRGVAADRCRAEAEGCREGGLPLFPSLCCTNFWLFCLSIFYCAPSRGRGVAAGVCSF